jgi:hypothetical protein
MLGCDGVVRMGDPSGLFDFDHANNMGFLREMYPRGLIVLLYYVGFLTVIIIIPISIIVHFLVFGGYTGHKAGKSYAHLNARSRHNLRVLANFL